MRAKASAGAVGYRPARLMQRLEQVDPYARTPVRHAAPYRRSRKGAYFALGLFGGALAGAVALVAFDVVAPSQVRTYGEQGMAALTAFCPRMW